MIKRTVYVTSPAYLKYKHCQMVIHNTGEGPSGTVPVEDIGFLVLENPQITITLPLLNALNANNTAVIFCDFSHMPASMLLNLEGHHIQTEMFRHQIGSSLPLKKNLWKQIVVRKIQNQAALLKKLNKSYKSLIRYSEEVKSGDSENREGVAARFYWQHLMGKTFRRSRSGGFPNAMFNYGYMVLRAAVARALTGSGLLPTFGIHHHNKYNAFCLADDIMEPYRPFVDDIVFNIARNCEKKPELSREQKTEILKILTADTTFNKNTHPLMIGLSRTTSSLAKCFAGEQRNLSLPKFE